MTNDMLNAELAKASEVDAENKVCHRLDPYHQGCREGELWDQ